MKHRILSATILTLLAGATAPLSAQPLSSKVAELIRFGTCDQALCLVTGAGEHQSHYIGAAQNASTDLLNFLTNAITASVGRLPISATSSGTSFSFVNGAPVRSTTSSGPIFAERATTLGKGRVLAGVNTSRISYSKLRGVSTDNLVINLAHQDVGNSGLGDVNFEADVIGIKLDMAMSLQVTTLFSTYGLTDRIDVSVAVPLVMSSLDGTGRGTVFNAATGAVTGVHFFGTAGAPSLTADSKADGSATGIGDIAARAKINIAGTNTGGLALLADVRLPTGDKDQFHGAGAVAASGLLIASTRYGSFSPHANLGYAMRTGDGQNSAFLATLGFDHLLSKSTTVAVDILSETQMGGDAGKLPSTIVLTNPAKTVIGTNIPVQKDNPISLSAGARFLLSDFTVLANGLMPIKSGGLQANFVWTLGIERTF